MPRWESAPRPSRPGTGVELMDTLTPSLALTGVVPPVCDAEAGPEPVSMRKLQSVMAELCTAIRSAMDDERGTAEDSLRRASQLLEAINEVPDTLQQHIRD